LKLKLVSSNNLCLKMAFIHKWTLTNTPSVLK
jgi:hypothetical protein